MRKRSKNGNTKKDNILAVYNGYQFPRVKTRRKLKSKKTILCKNTYKIINKNKHQININKIISNKNIVKLQKIKNIQNDYTFWIEIMIYFY